MTRNADYVFEDYNNLNFVLQTNEKEIVMSWPLLNPLETLKINDKYSRPGATQR